MEFPDFRYSEQHAHQLGSILEHQGIENPAWLYSELMHIASAYEWSVWRRDTEMLKRAIAGWRKNVDAVQDALVLLRRDGPMLSSPTVDDSGEMPVLVPADLTDENIAMAEVVLSKLADHASGIYEGLSQWFDNRPKKNEQPEIDGLVRGLAKLWCTACNISVAHIKISESAGSPSANFIEIGVEMLIGEAPSRKSIVTRVIAYRDEEKAKLS